MKYEDIPPGSFTYYVMLEALLDTRMGTLMRLGPKYAITATTSKGYIDRDSDDLTDVLKVKGYNQDHFNKLYAQRDMSTLFYSPQTAMVSYLRESIAEVILARADGDPRVKDVHVFVNCYPYGFDDTDAHYMKQVLSHALCVPLTNLHMEVRTTKDMNVGWLEALKPEILVVYHLNDWLKDMGLPMTREKFAELMVSPETICLTPGLLLDRHQKAKLKEMDLTTLTDKDPFTITRKALSGIFSLQVLPARIFSVQRYVSKEKHMSDLNLGYRQVQAMNQIAGRTVENKPNAIIAQFEQVAEEFSETVHGLVDGITKGDWNEFRNGLGDMVVVIWGEASVAEFPLVDDFEKIMQKNLSKFDKDYATATASLSAAVDKGYKCELKETNIDGQTYYPIITTDSGTILNEDGSKTNYNKGKFLKSVLWSTEEFIQAPNLPKASQSPEDLERLTALVESIGSRFSALGMALRESMKD